MSGREVAIGRKRILLLAVAACLCLSALLAVGILLFGRFGPTEGRILGTTALLAAFGLLALPAAILLDQGRLRPLAGAVAALAALATAVAVASVWTPRAPDALGRAQGSLLVFALAATQTASLAAWRRSRDSGPLRTLFAASVVLALLAASLVTGMIWLAGDDPGRIARVAGALIVLDALTVALQPLVARARVEPRPIRLRLTLDAGDVVERVVEASDLATGTARAVRGAERAGRQVRSIEVVGPTEPAVSAAGGRGRAAPRPRS